MKKLLFVGLLILVPFIFLPVTMVQNTQTESNNFEETPSSQRPSSPDELLRHNKELSTDEITYIATYASDFLKKNDSVVLKKAVVSICKNNYLYYQAENKTPEKLKISHYSDALFDELSDMICKVNIPLRYKDNIVYIPIVRNSGTSTGISEDFPYMVSVASPWEVSGKAFTRFADYPCGVSVYGMSCLAESGLSTEEILRWYLPEFTLN